MRNTSWSAAALLVLGFNAGASGSSQATLPTGIWGGQGIQLTVTDDGARLDYGCDSGTIDGRVQLDSSGKFVARGSHTFGQGGPRGRGDSAVKVHKASFEGTQEGKTLRLTVLLPELKRKLGDFALQLGRRASLERCG
jgi:hypothetical protein